MLNHIPLTALRAFGEVARHQSFTLAAEALHVTQSAVSQQVSQLEQRLGKRLVERSGRTLRLTPHGALLAATCHRSFGELDATLGQLARSGKVTSLRFKLPPTFAMRWLMPRLPRFQVLHPDYELHVSTSVQPVDFEAEDVDLSMQRAQRIDAGLHAVSVIVERGLPVCAPKLWDNRSAEISELAGMTILHSANRRDDWPQWLAAAGSPQHKIGNSLEFEFSLMAYQAALEGLGVAIAQPEYVADDLASGRLIAPFEQVLVTGKSYFVTCPAPRRHAPAIAAFLRWIQSELKTASR